MKLSILLKVVVCGSVLPLASAALAENRVRTSDLIVFSTLVENQNGEAPEAPEDLLFDVDRCDPAVRNPVLAPNGHQLTWGEYSRVAGRASLRAGPRGTHVVIQLSGLIAHGVYTLWVVPFAEPGFTSDHAHMTGEGTLGPADGSKGSFRASAGGRAAIAVHHPAGPLSVFGEVGGFLPDEFEVHLVGAYHPNGQVYGPTPGPADHPNPLCFFVEQFAFAFRN